MTAANISALVEVRPHRSRTSARSVTIAGTQWPVYKLHALLAAVIVGVLALAITGSAQTVAWASGVALLTVWWTERFWQAHRSH
ncbi:hypothetical protein GTV32_02380 [Gordonia sp. SID5947]|uniref:hypothetical protein n=1 Tax=Gordonia sp. SID5947 TaxID=2690315 RepID=UPI0013701B3A|nr:hypothetical protein [Gordonia sp. SID5947]MYR05240.1 hypothetical protein [Gordonia sp. SID5947]